MGFLPEEVNLHLREARATRRARKIDGGPLARPRVGDGERLQEVVDLVGGHRQLEHVVIDVRRALEISNAVAVNDDAAERRVVGMNVAGRARASDEEKRQCEEGLSHVGTIVEK